MGRLRAGQAEVSGEKEQPRPESFSQATHAERSVTRTDIGMVGYEYSGPLPPPIVLRQLEDILPGSAERIFAQFELQAEHRRRSETTVLASNAFSQKLGAVSAAIIGIGGTSGGIWLVAHGESIIGFGTLLVALGSIVGTFLHQTSAQESDRAAKRPNKGSTK